MVIAIIGVLVAMLLPAVQAAREAARRTRARPCGVRASSCGRIDDATLTAISPNTSVQDRIRSPWCFNLRPQAPCIAIFQTWNQRQVTMATRSHHPGEKATAQQLLSLLEDQRRSPLILPSVEEIRELAQVGFMELARDSYEFARRVRIIVPRIVVFPFRLCDSDKVVLRAKFWVQLSKLVATPKAQNLLAAQLDQVIEVDLFDKPQREIYRQQIVGRPEGMTVAEASAACGITKTAGQHASNLQRLMDKLKITDPYIPVTKPPAGSRKLRRHLHPRYQFKPKPDAGEL